MKKLLLIVPIVLAMVGCTKVKQVIVKDVPLEDQQNLAEKYNGRSAWTRIVLEDAGEGGSVPRDEKVEIIDIDLHYTGAVNVRTLKRLKRIRYLLDIERPLTEEKVEARLSEIFWYDDPVLRQVSYIRKWGKKAAAAVMVHEVFIGMPAEAALESWGIPAKKNINEIGGKTNEQWVYPNGNVNKYIWLTDGKVTKWDD